MAINKSISNRTHKIVGGGCDTCGLCHPNRCFSCDGGGYKCDKGGSSFVPMGRFRSFDGNNWYNQVGGFNTGNQINYGINTGGSTGSIPQSKTGGAINTNPISTPISGGAVNTTPIKTGPTGPSSPSIPGCIDPTAINYNPSATVSNNSCQYPPPPPLPIYGCTNPGALNYNSSANNDDGSCTYDDCPCVYPVGTGANSSSNVGSSSSASTGVIQNYSKFGGGSTYSNFNQNGFGGYNDQMWFND
tara:strand:- start:3406 stop:4140 length:735 start_codon:yes stop_codon:yes gene_type:complete